MSEQSPESASAPLSLPDTPNLDWLRKQAKRGLAELRKTDPAARLADAQLALARTYGFSSWRTLKAHVDSLSVDGQLFDAARNGDVAALTALLDQHPGKLNVRTRPHEHTLLHLAAFAGHLASVDLLLKRGLDVNTREKGDNTYAMHWAAAAGHLEVVRHLADAGGDVVGHGDDHKLAVIGWATCWDGAGASAPDIDRRVMETIRARGGPPDLFTALALGDEATAAKLLSEDPGIARPGGSSFGVLHLMAKRNNLAAVKWLLDHGVDPNALWSHWDVEVTPLHLAASQGHEDVVRALLPAGADPRIRDSRHDSDARGWAEFFGKPETVKILEAYAVRS